MRADRVVILCAVLFSTPRSIRRNTTMTTAKTPNKTVSAVLLFLNRENKSMSDQEVLGVKKE
jgi:hypothetical protein